MITHFYLIINGNAGSGNGRKTAKKIVKKFQNRHLDHTIFYTEYAGHEAVIAKELAEQHLLPWNPSKKTESFPLLVVLGGDGTLHSITNVLKGFDESIPLGYIPCGSGNDFARGAGISRQAEEAFEQLISAQTPQEINVVKFEEAIREEKSLAVNNIGIGIDAAIVQAANTSNSKQTLNKFNLGSFSYAFSILKVLFFQKSFPLLVEINGKSLEFDRAFLCTVTVHPYFGGGVAIAPNADSRKPVLDLVIVERINIFKIFWLIMLILRKQQMKSKHFHHFQSSKLRIVSTIPQYVHADGEILGERSMDCFFSTTKKLFWF